MTQARALLVKRHWKLRGKPLVRLRCLPALYVVGMYKSGSTDLYDKISLHPEVTPALTKSSQFPGKSKTFDDYLEYYDLAAERIRKNPSLVTLDAYATLFRSRSSDGKVDSHFGEYSLKNSHLYIAEIRMYNPRAIFMLNLRNPVTWIYSAYNFWGENTSPEDFHTIIRRGVSSFQSCVRNHTSVAWCVINHKPSVERPESRVFELPYYVFVQELRKEVPPEHLMVIRAENYYAQRESILVPVFEKLGLKSMPKQWYNNVVNNRGVAGNSKHYRPMLNITKQLLTDFVQPFNERLADMLGDQGFRWGA